MQDNRVRSYFYDIKQTVTTILAGMRVTLKHCFAKTVTLQYPDVAPALMPRYRGFHFYEIEKCIACDLCAKACPVDCIYIEKTGPRKLDKESGIARGGALTRYAIDYAKCMFCALCIEPCPTECIHMGNVHDMSGYTREDMIVEFAELAKAGAQTPQPLWMRRDKLPGWAEQRRQEWIEFAHSDDKLTKQNERRREAMVAALDPVKMAVKKKKKAESDS
ncbi:MAG: NuoI/complex I 23 kDa subunit family protein [Planctomycetota bacterium]|jgi:NADH-quinone oxidoreductase subunit I